MFLNVIKSVSCHKKMLFVIDTKNQKLNFELFLNYIENKRTVQTKRKNYRLLLVLY